VRIAIGDFSRMTHLSIKALRHYHIQIPAAELAVAVHHGPFAELDRTYAAVGAHVAERELGVDGPIREYYLETGIEVCWPIFRTSATA
jgi:hypothetical protein